jgi:hypothetical protein
VAGDSTFDQIEKALVAKSTALVAASAPDLLKLLDTTFVYVNSHGMRLDRAQYVELCCTSGLLKFRSQTYSDLSVVDYGSFALATLLVHDEFEYEGVKHSGTFQSFCAFRKVGSAWLWSGGQAMALSKNSD